VRQEGGSGGGQNYGAFRAADGSCPVLEAKVYLHSQEHPDWKEMTVGVPLARLPQGAGAREIELRFAGARWQMRVGGLYEEDFPFGRAQWETNAVWVLKSPRATSAALWTPPLPDAPCPAGTDTVLRKTRRTTGSRFPGKLRPVRGLYARILIFHIMDFLMGVIPRFGPGLFCSVFYRAWLFRRLLLCQLIAGGVQLRAGLFGPELGFFKPLAILCRFFAVRGRAVLMRGFILLP